MYMYLYRTGKCLTGIIFSEGTNLRIMGIGFEKIQSKNHVPLYVAIQIRNLGAIEVSLAKNNGLMSRQKKKHKQMTATRT